MTESEIRDALARMSKAEKDDLRKMPMKEQLVLLAIYVHFPGAHQIEEIPK